VSIRGLVIAIVGCISAAPLGAVAQDDTSIFGTHAVVFQPIRAGGLLEGCTLVYRAVQADHVYKSGQPVVIIGNIGIHQYGARVILALKIGVRDLGAPNAPITRPHFAYLLTDKSSTAQISHQSREGDEGYRLIVVALEDSVTALVLEMAEAGKVTIAFNRRESGMDVLVPVDLMVHDAEYANSGAVMRKRSPDSMMKFLDCFQQILGQAIEKPSK
jgi:hypothetical protein